MAVKIEFAVQFLEVDADELPADELSLLIAAQKATSTSYSPYSSFCVGAALLLEDGTIICGSNQENAAYPSGLCAERVAFFTAGANHMGKKINKIAVTAKKANGTMFLPISPCGSCRQVMLEYENKQMTKIRLILQETNTKVLISDSVEQLLPLKFTENSLFKPV